MLVIRIWVCILRHKYPRDMSGTPAVSDALGVPITISMTHLIFFSFSGEDYDRRNNRKKTSFICLLPVEAKVY